MWLDQRGKSECTQTNFTPMYNRRSGKSHVKTQNIFSFLLERPSVPSFLGAASFFEFFSSRYGISSRDTWLRTEFQKQPPRQKL